MCEQMRQVATCDVASNWHTEFIGWLRGKSKNTTAGYLQDIRVFSAWFKAHTGEVFHPELLNSFDLYAFREHSLGVQHVAAATWNRRRASLMALCSWAGLPQLMDGVRPQAEVEAPPRSLNQADVAKLLRTIEQRIYQANTKKRKHLAIRDAAMVVLFLMAGLRVSEACDLRCEDIDITPRKGRVIVRRGKEDKQRIVPLSAIARRFILQWLELIKSGPFLDITPREAQKIIAELKQAARIEADLTPHVLRHTFCYRLSKACEPLSVQKQLMGHVKPESTMIYSRPSWEDLEMAVEAGNLGVFR